MTTFKGGRMSDQVPPIDYSPTATTSARKTLNGIEYAIDSAAPYTIYAWNPATPNPEDAPFWYQPHDLNGDAWTDAKTSEAFAIAHITENFSVTPVTPESN